MRKLRILARSGVAFALVFTGGLSAAAGDRGPFPFLFERVSAA